MHTVINNSSFTCSSAPQNISGNENAQTQDLAQQKEPLFLKVQIRTVREAEITAC